MIVDRLLIQMPQINYDVFLFFREWKVDKAVEAFVSSKMEGCLLFLTSSVLFLGF